MLLLHLFNPEEICLCRPFHKNICVLALLMALFCWVYFYLLWTVVLLPGLFVTCFGLVSLWVYAFWFIFKIFYLVAVSLSIAVAVRMCRIKAWGFAPEHNVQLLPTTQPMKMFGVPFWLLYADDCLWMMNAVHVIVSFQPTKESWLIRRFSQ